jgi:hypothetical protein
MKQHVLPDIATKHDLDALFIRLILAGTTIAALAVAASKAL